jgi:hypothetical protein
LDRNRFNDDAKPWDFHRDLTEERLVEIARILIGVWRQAVTEHAPERGDDWWVLCCRCYQRSTFAIASATERFGWLEVLDPSRCFHFTIGEVPVRFYHGEPSAPNQRTLRQHRPELRQRQLVLGLGHQWIGSDTFWRIAIETNDEGEVSAIFLVQCSPSGAVLWSWQIPTNDPIASMPPVAPPTAPIVLPRPAVTDLDDDQDLQDDEQ